MASKPAQLPEWASDAGADIVEPSAAKKQTGWIVERPPHQYFNWWKNLVYKWMQYLSDQVFEGDLSLGGRLYEIGKRKTISLLNVAPIYSGTSFLNLSGDLTGTTNEVFKIPIPLDRKDVIREIYVYAEASGGTIVEMLPVQVTKGNVDSNLGNDSAAPSGDVTLSLTGLSLAGAEGRTYQLRLETSNADGSSWYFYSIEVVYDVVA